jgi:hypothetical protein
MELQRDGVAFYRARLLDGDPSPPVSWLQLGGRFCVELGSGTLAALALVPPAPVGPPFYRLLGGLASIPLLVGSWLLASEGALGAPVAVAVAVALVSIAGFAWPTKGRGRWIALGVAIAASAAAVVFGVMESIGAGLGVRALASASALGSGMVVGAVGVAMALGHAYLTYPNLKIVHLVRVNRWTGFVLVAKATLVALALALLAERYEPLRRALSSLGVVFGLVTRAAVGLAVPLVFAAMVGSCLRYRNTRSATGILYASTVLVLIGEALATSLRGQAGGIPL